MRMGCLSLTAALAVVGTIAGGGDTSAQGQRARGTPAASQQAKEAIFARKILMTTIGDNMDEIESMLDPGGKFEVEEAREHANLISVMLLAFPHMFPPSTNQWRDNADRDPALDTFASPEVWRRFPDFYKRSADLSKIALEAAKAQHFKDYKARVAELRSGCDGCHALYLKEDPKAKKDKR